MYYSQVHHNHRFRHILTISVSSLIGIAGGLVVLLLGARFVLLFVQIDQLPSFTATVYNLSYPFVAPISHVLDQIAAQYQTLIAIGFWAIATWLLTSLTALTDPD